MGVLLYTIIFGENPFAHKKEIVACRYSFPHQIDPCKSLFIDLKAEILKNLKFWSSQRLDWENAYKKNGREDHLEGSK